MASVTIGGDPENYMDPPRMSVGGEGGGNFIASLLGLITGTPVGALKSNDSKPAAEQVDPATKMPAAAPTPEPGSSLPILNQMSSAFAPPPAPNAPLNWGQSFLSTTRPIQSIDPNSQF